MNFCINCKYCKCREIGWELRDALKNPIFYDKSFDCYHPDNTVETINAVGIYKKHPFCIDVNKNNNCNKFIQYNKNNDKIKIISYKENDTKLFLNCILLSCIITLIILR